MRQHKCKVISSISELQELIRYCKDTGYACIDYETNARNPKDPEFYPTILSVSFQPGSGWVIPLGHKDSKFNSRWRTIHKIFSTQVLEDPDIIKIAWNASFEYKVALSLGHRIRGRLFDAMLAKYLLNEYPPNDLKSQVATLIPEYAGYDLPNQPGKKASKEALINFWTNVDFTTLSEYGALDADLCFRLFIHYENRLMEKELYHYFRNFYGPLIRIMGETQLEGVDVDPIYLAGQVKEFQGKLDVLEKDIRDIPFIEEYEERMITERVNAHIEELEDGIDSGDLTDNQIDNREAKISRLEMGSWSTNKEAKLFEPMNFNSPKQMAELLYLSPHGLELDIPEYTDAGNPSCSEDALLVLRKDDDTGFISKLLQHRELTKMFTTYIKGIYENHLTDWGTIHPGYLMQGTITGRFSSRNPSFQTMPRTTTSAEIKRQFIAPENHFFVEIDASQAELRVVAEIAGDRAMLSAFREGKNIHVTTAALVSGHKYEEINSLRKDETHSDHVWAVKEHKKAKVLNFTILYGAGPPTVSSFLSEATGEYHSEGDAKGMINQWFEAYPEVKYWVKKTHRFAERNGFVENPFGRKRRFPVLLEPGNKTYKKAAWSEALRQGPNAMIQGCASDITQWTNIKIQEARWKGDLPEYLRLLSTVHDSLEYYIHMNDIGIVIPKMLSLAKSLPDLEKYMGWTMRSVEMKFSAEFGINWGTVHEYDPKKHGEGFDFAALYREDWDKFNSQPFTHIRR